MDLLKKAIDLARKGKVEEALKAFDDAIRKEGDRSEILGHRAWCLRAIGRYEEALLDYEELASLDPHNLDARCRLAETRLLSGDRAGAESELKALIAEAPNNQTVLYLFGRYSEICGGGDKQPVRFGPCRVGSRPTGSPGLSIP